MKIFLTKCNTVATTETEVLEDIEFPQRVHWFPETYNRVESGLFYVPHRLADKVVTKDIIDFVKNRPVHGKSAFILAGGSQNWAGEKQVKDPKPSRLRYTYKLPLISMTQIYAGKMASLFGIYDYISTDASACASSLKVMMDIRNLINNLGFDRVVVLTLEDQVSIPTLEFFGKSKASILLEDEKKGAVPSAFDSKNGGFVIGQGCAVAVFESERAVNKNKSYILAELLSANISGEDITNPIGQRPDGMGYQNAIRGAIEMANIRPGAIKLVKTHGTGTDSNNLAEKTALEATLDKFVATSYKQHIGHTVAASGLLETCLLLQSINLTHKVPPIKNRTEEDKVFLSEEIYAPDGLLLSLAAGMGNIYAAAIFNYTL
jgi:3-oxoacyl-(acyl-carrier-protein) synthase